MTQDNKSYKWNEYAALLPNGKMIRGQFIHSENIQVIENFRKQFNNTDIFYGISQHLEPSFDSEFIISMFFDIDSKDNLSAAKESAICLCEMIMDRIKLTENQIEIFFSGNKGFHVIVPCEVFSAFYSPHILPMYKKMAKKAEQSGAKFIDQAVYTNKRIFRLSNSINSKSNLYKIPLTFEELRDIDVSGILEISKSPRPEESFCNSKPSATAIHWYREAIKCMKNKNNQFSSIKKLNIKFKHGWRIPPCIKEIEKTILPDGIRHDTYLLLARYYSYLNMHYYEIVERLGNIDNRNPIRDLDSIERITEFAIEHPGFAGCDNQVLKKYCKNQNCFYAKLKNNNAE
ncbi:MAG: hypothetical protein A2Y10_05905 [Planctomycetes bacterium GWF2_41_51]|nr:MAG: hypothetical protein A2Y10_05905 [Planctomycetes bacterium GWF2_41_51]